MGKCKNCYYFGQCCSEDECEYFTSVDDDLTDEEIEESRQEYHEAWFEYINDDE